MKYDDMRKARELVNKASLFASNMVYSTTTSELYQYHALAIDALTKLNNMVQKELGFSPPEPTPPCCCETCYFLNKNAEDFPYCTARGISIKNRYIEMCGLYECETMPAWKGEATREVY